MIQCPRPALPSSTSSTETISLCPSSSDTLHVFCFNVLPSDISGTALHVFELQPPPPLEREKRALPEPQRERRGTTPHAQCASMTTSSTSAPATAAQSAPSSIAAWPTPSTRTAGSSSGTVWSSTPPPRAGRARSSATGSGTGRARTRCARRGTTRRALWATRGCTTSCVTSARRVGRGKGAQG